MSRPAPESVHVSATHAAVSAKPRASRVRRLWRDYVRPMGVMVLCLTSFRSAVADWYDVPTGSMKPSILEGDRIVVNKMAYDLRVPFTRISVARISDPQRDDVVVFKSPKDGMRLVKRLVGVPGDVIEMRSNTLYINGEQAGYQPLAADVIHDVSPKDRAEAVFADETIPGAGRAHAVMGIPAARAARDFGPITVPAGKYFMLGDNRDNSADSRFIGFVDRSLILGRSRSIAFSLTDSYLPRMSRFFKHLP